MWSSTRQTEVDTYKKMTRQPAVSYAVRTQSRSSLSVTHPFDQRQLVPVHAGRPNHADRFTLEDFLE